MDSDLRQNEIDSNYFERSWFTEYKNDTRPEVFHQKYMDQPCSTDPNGFNVFQTPGDLFQSMINDVLALTFNNRIQNIPKHYYNYVACQKPINVSYIRVWRRE